jgi:divalent metal cation (Fe/Co/Zn/Cd) transporter
MMDVKAGVDRREGRTEGATAGMDGERTRLEEGDAGRHQLHSLALGSAERARLVRRAKVLAWILVGYNVVESTIAILAGRSADSSALIGFGLDSAMEVSGALVILWQFSHYVPEARERTALRLIGLSFLGIAGYIAWESVTALRLGAEPDSSLVGILLACASIVVMPVLSRAQRSAGRALGSRALEAAGAQTVLCAYVSSVLLAGLVLNAQFRWYWADSVAALFVAAVAAKEGVDAWREAG